MSRSILTFSRPVDLDEETKERIAKMFGSWVFINWEKEYITFGSSPMPMEKLGKFIALMHQKCITVRKNKSKL